MQKIMQKIEERKPLNQEETGKLKTLVDPESPVIKHEGEVYDFSPWIEVVALSEAGEYIPTDRELRERPPKGVEYRARFFGILTA